MSTMPNALAIDVKDGIADLEEIERQTSLRCNETSIHVRRPGRKLGWGLSPNIARAAASRESEPQQPAVAIKLAPVEVAAAIAPPPIEIRSMQEMVAAFRACRDEREITHETVDDIAGWQSGYSSKLLAPTPIKNLGWMSLGAALGAFGKVLLLVDDPEQIKRVKDRWTPRERPHAR